MLEATRWSLTGLCFCLLAISAGALPSSTIFCCTFLPLLLFGCPLFARFLFPSQAKPVAVKRHRKRGRLKTDTVAKGSMGGLAQEELLSDASAVHAELWIAGGSWTFSMVVAAALSVAGIVATSLALAAWAGMQTGDSDAVHFHCGSKCRSFSGNGLRSDCSSSLGSDARSGYGCGYRLGSGDGSRLGDRLDSDACGQFRHDGGSRPGHDSCGGGQLGRLGWSGGDRLGDGTRGSGSGGQLGCNGRSRLRCADAHRYRLGSEVGDRPGRDGSVVLSYDNDEGLRVGGSSLDRLKYVVIDHKTGSDGGTVGNRTAARKGSGSALLPRMLFDKDNPADKRTTPRRGVTEEKQEGYSIRETSG